MTSFETITTKELGKLELSEPSAQNTWTSTRTVMVDTSATLKCLVDTLTTLEQSPGSIYVDLEGVKLSHLGSISIIQILVPSCEQVFIVDIHTLGKTAFDTLGAEGKSLKDVFESGTIKKYLFDVRNDSDALYALFGVRLTNAIDIQLLELASRQGPKHIVCGLAKCIEQEQALPSLALLEWQSTKKEVIKMFDPELGGSYEVFNARPLPQILIEYCVGDVDFLPLLSTIYQNRLDRHWLEKVRVETEKRLEESRSPSYQPHGRQKSFGPKRWRFPPREGKRSPPKVTAAAFKEGKKLAVPVAVPVPKSGEKSAAVPAPAPKDNDKKSATPAAAGPAPKRGKKPTAAVGGFASKQGKHSTASSVSATLASQKVLIQAASHQDGRHQPMATAPKGGGKGKAKVGEKSTAKRPPTSASSNVSYRNTPYAQDWSLCDKDCGWCGRCGDGIL